MTADTPESPDMNDDDDIARAYAQSRTLADDGRAPSAAVRANVLAAAREIAAESASRRAAEVAVPLAVVPVAPPLAEVGRGRGRAINLSSWRVRSGAALCAMLLVGLVSWRFDSAHRLGGGVQVCVGGVGAAHADVGGDGVVEQQGVLADIGDGLAQAGDGDGAEVSAVERDGAGTDVVQAGDEGEGR